jgi:hypothetical protein
MPILRHNLLAQPAALLAIQQDNQGSHLREGPLGSAIMPAEVSAGFQEVLAALALPPVGHSVPYWLLLNECADQKVLGLADGNLLYQLPCGFLATIYIYVL